LGNISASLTIHCFRFLDVDYSQNIAAGWTPDYQIAYFNIAVFTDWLSKTARPCE
jgi:hypothetical protein